MKTLIYAVDDESSIRELYEYSITNADMECATFENADDFFKALSHKLPDLIILDIMLEGMDGYKILEKLKSESRRASIPVIMVSAKGEEISKVKGLDLGADDYISKPFGVLELIARIKANLRKKSNSSDKKILQYKDIVIDEFKHTCTVNDNEITLTLKEFKLLTELLSKAGETLNREELLNIVWGYEFVGETRTLDIHIASIRKLLDENKSQTEIVTVRKVGYMLK